MAEQAENEMAVDKPEKPGANIQSLVDTRFSGLFKKFDFVPKGKKVWTIPCLKLALMNPSLQTSSSGPNSAQAPSSKKPNSKPRAGKPSASKANKKLKDKKGGGRKTQTGKGSKGKGKQ